MPFPLIPAILAGASAIGSAISNKKGARTSTSTPTIAPEFKTLSDLLRSRAEERLRSSVDLSGLASTGTQNINDAFAGGRLASENNLTARGLGTSPVAAAVGSDSDQARVGSIAQFLNTLPTLQRQFQDQDMAMAGNVLGRFGTGTTGVGAGSALGSGIGSAAEMLAFLKGQGVF